jgi:hypothetical protein
LKIILKKKGGKRIRAPIGLTLTKANAPTVSPPSTIIGKGKDKGKITLPTTLPGRGMSYAHTLKQTIKKEKGADNVPDFEPPQLGMDLQRKL